MLSPKNGGYAAFTTVVTGVLMFLTVIIGVGAEAMSDPTLIAGVVASKIPPLAFIEVLKIIQGIATILLVRVVQSLLHRTASPLLQGVTIAGILSGVFLIGAGVNGLGALALASQASTVSIGIPLDYLTVNAIVNGLGRISQFASGLWFLPISWLMLEEGNFPKGLSYLGFVVGALNIIAASFPPVGILLLLFATIWMVWIGRLLVQTQRTPALA